MNKESVQDIVKDSVESLKYILLDNYINHGKIKDTLKIVIHHTEKKITSEDCTLVADIISRRLDIDDPFDRPYDLIVESPGLEREIKSSLEYNYFLGREFKFFIENSEDIITKEGFLIAILQKIENNILTVIQGKQQIDIPLETIKKAKLYCDYNKILRDSKNK